MVLRGNWTCGVWGAEGGRRQDSGEYWFWLERERGPSKEGIAFGEGDKADSGQWAVGCAGRHTDPGTVRAHHPLQVYVKISIPKGIQFVGHPGKRHLTKKMCVASGETEPIWVVLSFSNLGLSNITGEGPVLWAPPSRPPRDPRH